MARRTTQGRTNGRIKFKIYSTILLYSKKEWIFTTSIKLQKVELAHNKG